MEVKKIKELTEKINFPLNESLRPNKSLPSDEAGANLITCPTCQTAINESRMSEAYFVCPECGHYLRMGAMKRLKMAADRDSFEPWLAEMPTNTGPSLKVPVSNISANDEYRRKLAAAQRDTGLDEAVIIGKASVGGEPAVIGVCDANFIMGTMGYGVGEKIAAAVERATALKLPVFLFCCSGGARMQEGIISLMQMAKTAAALKRHAEEKLLYVSILTDPTMGGVTASFAMLGDVILAEPGALIGFAGPRVIKKALGRDLPPKAQTAEYLVEHGIIDGIVTRARLKETMYYLIKTHRVPALSGKRITRNKIKTFPTELAREKDFYAAPLGAWQKVAKARSMERPEALDYINHIFEDFYILHGDREYGDDQALIGGLALFNGRPVTVIAGRKGKSTEEALRNRFGMPMPEGYRKALRIMKAAEKFRRPVICFIDTPGAYCGLEAEERGQAGAIAQNLFEMSALTVPILCIIVGEAGSGGALATAVGNEVWMLENSLYSIISPEGYAEILWKDGSRADEAAEIMKMTAQDHQAAGIVEQIIPEYGGADAVTLSSISGYMKGKIVDFLDRYEKYSPERIVKQRYQRFRNF